MDYLLLQQSYVNMEFIINNKLYINYIFFLICNYNMKKSQKNFFCSSSEPCNFNEHEQGQNKDTTNKIMITYQKRKHSTVFLLDSEDLMKKTQLNL